MMWQTVITGIIVSAALIYTGLKLYRYVADPLRKCRSCPGQCGGCALEERKREMERKGQGAGVKEQGRGIGD